MDPLLPGPLASSNQAPPSRGESVDPTFQSELTVDDQGDRHRQVPRIHLAGNPIPLIYELFLTFTIVPLLAVLGQHILSSFCWAAHSIPVCATHTLTGYLLTYQATIIGLLLLSSCWLIMAINEPAWCAIQFAASPVGSLALRWLMDGDNGNDSRPLSPLWILLAMAVGQGIVRAISHHALTRQHRRTINDFGRRSTSIFENALKIVGQSETLSLAEFYGLLVNGVPFLMMMLGG